MLRHRKKMMKILHASTIFHHFKAIRSATSSYRSMPLVRFAHAFIIRRRGRPLYRRRRRSRRRGTSRRRGRRCGGWGCSNATPTARCRRRRSRIIPLAALPRSSHPRANVASSVAPLAAAGLWYAALPNLALFVFRSVTHTQQKQH